MTVLNLLVAAILAMYAEARILQLAQAALQETTDMGEVCDIGTEAVCRRTSQCSHVKQLNHLQLCSFINGSVPVVCCPPTLSKANQSCLALQECAQLKGPQCDGFMRAGKFKRETSEKYVTIKPDVGTSRLNSIVGGDPVKKIRSYMALIGYGDPPSRRWSCGGSVLTRRYILSAAHCANSYHMGPAAWAKIGFLQYSAENDTLDPSDFMIVQRWVHPDYNEPAIYNDIALFKIDKDFEFWNIGGPVLCLHNSPSRPRKVFAAGWGMTEFAGRKSNRLMEVDLELFSDEECNSIFSKLVSQKVPHGYNSTSMGDSGGPIYVNDPGRSVATQIGITSFGRKCGMANSPGIYTRVSHYVPWIESIVWSN